MNIPKQPILLVESDNDSRELACWYLTRAGYQMTAVTADADGLMLAGTGQFKLYLLGEGFEDSTNLDLCLKIRSFDSDTPILFCSAWTHPDDIGRGMKAGAQAYLTKPCDLDVLVQIIEQLVGETADQAAAKSAGLQELVKEGAPNRRRGLLRFVHPSLSAGEGVWQA